MNESTGQRYTNEYGHEATAGDMEVGLEYLTIGEGIVGQSYIMHSVEGLEEATAELRALGKILLLLEARLASMEGKVERVMNRDYEEKG